MPWNPDVMESLKGDYVKFEPGEKKTLYLDSEVELGTKEYDGATKTAWTLKVRETGSDTPRKWQTTSYTVVQDLLALFPDGTEGKTVVVKRIGKGMSTTYDIEAGK